MDYTEASAKKLGPLQVSDRAPSHTVELPVRRIARAGIRARRVERGVPFSPRVYHAYYAFDDVVDVGEVADHLAVVEDVDGAAGPKDRTP